MGKSNQETLPLTRLWHSMTPSEKARLLGGVGLSAASMALLRKNHPFSTSLRNQRLGLAGALGGTGVSAHAIDSALSRRREKGAPSLDRGLQKRAKLAVLLGLLAAAESGKTRPFGRYRYSRYSRVRDPHHEIGLIQRMRKDKAIAQALSGASGGLLSTGAAMLGAQAHDNRMRLHRRVKELDQRGRRTDRRTLRGGRGPGDGTGRLSRKNRRRRMS